MSVDQNRLLYQIFHGHPIPVQWDGWQSDTHTLHRRGWEIMAEDARDDYCMGHRLRLGLLSPEKRFVVTGNIHIPYQELFQGQVDWMSIMHRYGFQDMGMIHQRDMIKTFPHAEISRINSMKSFNPYEPVVARSEDLYRGTFKFFNYVEGNNKEIIIPPANVEECLNQILKLQYPEQMNIKKKLLLPETKPIIQAKIFTLAA